MWRKVGSSPRRRATAAISQTRRKVTPEDRPFTDMTNSTAKADALESLAKGIAQLTSSDRWTEWLKVQSRFHEYSFSNTVLILVQRPEATRVTGFNAWRKLNRSVRKGEKAIRILAPMIYKPTATQDGPEETEACRSVRGFKAVPVFDLSQTDGEELPEVCRRLTGDQLDNTYGHLQSVAHRHGFTVEEARLGSEINGICDHVLKRIRIETRNSETQRVKTLAHELGHAILHNPCDGDTGSRSLKELEAESVAFVVCRNRDIDTSDYSFGYVAAWAGGSEEAHNAIRTSGPRIQRAANEILVAIKEMCPDPMEWASRSSISTF